MFRNPFWFRRFIQIVRDYINPSIDIVEAIKQAVKSPEQKFLDLLFGLYGEGNAFEEACLLVRMAIKRLDVASECGLEESNTDMIDCFVGALRKEKKGIRNAIYRQLARELAELSLGDNRLWESLKNDQKDTVVQLAYSRKKNEA